jgi:nitroreductase
MSQTHASEPSADPAIDRIFLSARTFNKFSDRALDDGTIRKLHDLWKWGPTSMNCQPARVVFVRTLQGKEKLRAALMPNNVEKTMAAPAVAIVAYDSAFYEHMPSQFPANPTAREMFASKQALAEETAFRNGSLQGAYLILAARALGLAAGPMSGFDAAKVNQLFFPEGLWRANFLVNLGWGDPSGNRPRGPRLPYDEVVRFA